MHMHTDESHSVLKCGACTFAHYLLQCTIVLITPLPVQGAQLPNLSLEKLKLRCSLFVCLPSQHSYNAGNTSWRVWLACLSPFQTLPDTFNPHISLITRSDATVSQQQCTTRRAHVYSHRAVNTSQLHQAHSMQLQQDAVIHAAGWLFSCASALWLQHQLKLSAAASLPSHSLSLLLPQVVNGFLVTAVAAVASDLFHYQSLSRPIPGSPPGFSCFHCGNFGIMLADACNQSVDIVKVTASLFTRTASR